MHDFRTSILVLQTLEHVADCVAACVGWGGGGGGIPQHNQVTYNGGQGMFCAKYNRYFRFVLSNWEISH